MNNAYRDLQDRMRDAREMERCSILAPARPKEYGTVQFDATVRGGFPVIVEIYADAPDPETGYLGAFDVERILTRDGKSADFLRLTAGEIEALRTECEEQL